MTGDLFEFEQETLDAADGRLRGDDEANWAAYRALVEDYRRLLSQSRRLIKVGNTLERKRLSQMEAKNAELQALHRSHARFVPTEVLELLLKRDITEISLGDHIEFDAAILFADIRGFTPLAESLPPRRVFELLNAYLGAVSPLIKARGGVVDKIHGDGVMAYFPYSAEDALFAALDIQDAVARLNAELFQPQYGLSIEVGIGIHAGPCILGTLGDDERMDTTVISDAVNVASRIQDQTKLYRCPVLISQAVFQQSLFTADFVFRFVDIVRLKGKNGPTSVYEARRRSGLGPQTLALVDRFEQGAFAWHEDRTAEAAEVFGELAAAWPDDVPTALYCKRCRTGAAALED